MKKGVPKNFANFTTRRPANLLKKETLEHAFSCEFRKTIKNSFFLEHFDF